MIRLGISPLFWIIIQWDTGCMLNSNTNNFIYSYRNTVNICCFCFMFDSFFEKYWTIPKLVVCTKQTIEQKVSNIIIALIATIFFTNLSMRFCYSNELLKNSYLKIYILYMLFKIARIFIFDPQIPKLFRD